MKCGACGAQNDSDSATCAECGAELGPPEVESTLSFESPTELGEEIRAEDFQLDEAPVLVVVGGPGAGERFALDRPATTLGRDPSSDIFLNDITVSRRHARVEVAADSATISDAGSLNGTYVNRERVEAMALKQGDEIQIGKFRLVFLPKRRP